MGGPCSFSLLPDLTSFFRRRYAMVGASGSRMRVKGVSVAEMYLAWGFWVTLGGARGYGGNAKD